MAVLYNSHILAQQVRRTSLHARSTWRVAHVACLAYLPLLLTLLPLAAALLGSGGSLCAQPQAPAGPGAPAISTLPADWPASYPNWWHERGVIDAMIQNRKHITLLFAAVFVFADPSNFGKWSYSEQNLAELDSKLDSLQREIETNGITAELEPFFLELGEYGFRHWLGSSEDAERNTRDIISKYNEVYLRTILESENCNGVVRNVASRLLSATNPNSLTESDIRRLVDDGESTDLAIYGITKHLGLYDGQVEEMVARVFIEEPENRVSLAVSLGLDAAAPFMLEAVSGPFDSESLTAETSLITTISAQGDVIEKEQVIYGFVKNGNAESIRRAAEWLLNTNKGYPEVAGALTLRFQEIDYFLPEGAMPQFRGLLQSAAATVVEIPADPTVEAVIEAVKEVGTPEPAIEEPAEVVAAEPVEEPVEKSSNWWFWLIGVVVVVGGISLVLRRKNESKQ